MAKIIQLPQEIINKIAAGEVVERPASIVKELVENSLDAKANHVKIAVVDGGKRSIVVEDNGVGIEKDDLELLLKRHTTSKIKTIEDLFNIKSFGFRGEAISSIAAVSRFSLTTRAEKEKVGNKLEFVDNKITITPYPRSVGTSVFVEDLFYNVPARQKFLKSAQTEYKYILEIVENFSIISFNTRFTLTKDNKEVFDLMPVQDRLARVLEVLRFTQDDIIFHKISDGYFSLELFLLHPKLLGQRSRFMKIFVNNRIVNDKGIIGALNAGIADYVPHAYRASAIVVLNVPESYVDVNVHPRKLEVKFANPYRVFAFVKGATKQAIAKAVESSMHIDSADSNKDLTKAYSNIEKEQENAVSRLRRPAYSNTSSDTLKQREDLSFSSKQNNISLPKPGLQKTFYSQLGQTVRDSGKVDSDFDKQDNSTGRDIYMHITSVVDMQEIKNVYQLLNRYILVEWETEIWIIDQHAAAERIRYEDLIDRFKGLKSGGQRLLAFPEIPISLSEEQLLSQYKDLFTKLGFEYEIKKGAVVLKQAPEFLKHGNIDRIFRDVLTQIKDYDNIEADVQHLDFATDSKFNLLVATIACHNSIRANERMQPEELKAMVLQLLQCRVPYACPHGRRLVWILSSEDIDKNFMRT